MELLEERVEYTENRVHHLDALLGQFITSTGASLNRLSREMR